MAATTAGAGHRCQSDSDPAAGEEVEYGQKDCTDEKEVHRLSAYACHQSQYPEHDQQSY